MCVCVPVTWNLDVYIRPTNGQNSGREERDWLVRDKGLPVDACNNLRASAVCAQTASCTLAQYCNAAAFRSAGLNVPLSATMPSVSKVKRNAETA